MLDLVVVEVFESEARPLDTLLESQRLAVDEVFADLQELLGVLAPGLESSLNVVGFGQIRVDALYWFDKQVVEYFTTPL